MSLVINMDKTDPLIASGKLAKPKNSILYPLMGSFNSSSQGGRVMPVESTELVTLIGSAKINEECRKSFPINSSLSVEQRDSRDIDCRVVHADRALADGPIKKMYTY